VELQKIKKDFTTTKSCGRIEFSRTADYLLQMVLETKQTARKKQNERQDF